MKHPTLTALEGGGQPAEPVCALCERELFINGTRDDEVREAIRDFMGAQHDGRVRVCKSHREDLESLGFTMRPTVAVAANRKQRRARDAATRAEVRRLRPQLRAAPPPQDKGGKGGPPIAF